MSSNSGIKRYYCSNLGHCARADKRSSVSLTNEDEPNCPMCGQQLEESLPDIIAASIASKNGLYRTHFLPSLQGKSAKKTPDLDDVDLLATNRRNLMILAGVFAFSMLLIASLGGPASLCQITNVTALCTASETVPMPNMSPEVQEENKQVNSDESDSLAVP